LSEIEVFGRERGVIYVIYQISDKIESKNEVSEILGGKMEIFFLKSHSKISVPHPKVGAKSPPMAVTLRQRISYSYHVRSIT